MVITILTTIMLFTAAIMAQVVVNTRQARKAHLIWYTDEGVIVTSESNIPILKNMMVHADSVEVK